MTVEVTYSIKIGELSSLVDHTTRCTGFRLRQQLDWFRLSSQRLVLTFSNADGAMTPSEAGGGGTYASVDWFSQAVIVTASTNNGDTATLFCGLVDKFDLADSGRNSTVTIEAVDWLSIAARGPFTFPDVLGVDYMAEAVATVLDSLTHYTPNLLPLLGESEAIISERILTELTTGVRVNPLGAFVNQGDANVADVLASKLMPGGLSLAWAGRVDSAIGKATFRPNIVASALRRDPRTYSDFESDGGVIGPFPAGLPLDGDLTNNGTAGTITLSAGSPVSFASMPLPYDATAQGATTAWMTSNATLDALGGAGCWAHAIYIPSGLNVSNRYALWKNGGATNGQGMYIQRVSGTDRIRVTLVSIVSAVVSDYLQYDLPSDGYYTLGAEIPNTTLGFMRLYVNGVVVAEKAFLNATPTDGTNDPGFDLGLRSVETGTADLVNIDGSGIAVSHLIYGGYQSMFGSDWLTHYRLLFEPQTFGRTFTIADDGTGLPFAELDVGYNSADRVNFVRMESLLFDPFGGTATVEAKVTTSIEQYGVQSYSTTETEHDTSSDVQTGAWQIANRLSTVRWLPLRVRMSVGQFRGLADAVGADVAALLDHTSGLWNEAEITSTLTNASPTTTRTMIVGRTINATPTDTMIELELVARIDFQPFVLDDSSDGVLGTNRIG